MDYNNIVSSTSDRCGTVDLGVSGANATQATVQFKGEACSSVDILQPHTRLSSLHVKPDLMQVERYVRRPYKLDSWVLDSTTRTYDFAGTQFSPVMSRLSGALGFRCEIVARLQIIGSPFASGIYRLAWSPSVSRYRSDAWGANITMFSQLPGVNLNISEMTEVELRVPYHAVTDYLPVRLADWAVNDIYGTFWICPIATVDIGSASPVKATLWINFESVEVEGNTAPTMVSGTLQAGDISAPAVEQRCVDDHDCKASGLSSIRGVVDTVAPQLKPILGAAEWAIDKANGLARAFGYSKPNRLKAHRYVRPSRYMSLNTDVADDIPSIASHAYNNVSLINADSSDVNQMSLKTFASRYAVTGKFSLTTADTENMNKYYAHVHPLAAWMSTTAVSNVANQLSATYVFGSAAEDIIPSPMWYVSNLFTMWRGTVKFRFDLSKTKFHAGRLRITYSPSANYLAAVPPYLFPDVSDVVPIHGKSVIWDIRDSPFLEFECPYVWHRYFMPFNKVSASLSVIVVDPLIATTTVSSSITCLVSMAAGSDFEWANPVGSQYLWYSTPAAGVPPTTLLAEAEQGDNSLETTLLSQVTDGVASVEIGGKLQSGDVFDADLTLQDKLGSENAIGESIVSIKQLVSRPSWINISQQSTAYPFYLANCPTRANIDTFYYSWNGYFNCVFAFARGSTRFQLLSNIPTSKISMVIDGRGAVGTQGNGNAGMGLYQADYNLPVQSIVPYLSTNSRSTAGQGVTGYINYWGENYSSYAVLNVASGTAINGFTGKFLLAVSAGDDAQYFFQLPCPAFRGGFTTVATTASGVIASAFYSAFT